MTSASDDHPAPTIIGRLKQTCGTAAFDHHPLAICGAILSPLRMHRVTAARGHGETLEVARQCVESLAHRGALHGAAVPGDDKLRLQPSQPGNGLARCLPVMREI